MRRADLSEKDAVRLSEPGLERLKRLPRLNLIKITIKPI